MTAVSGDLPKTDDTTKYVNGDTVAIILGWVAGNTVVSSGEITEGEPVALLVDKTNFYAEGGGQVGDAGTITTATGRFDVDETQRLGDAVLHFGQVTEGKVGRRPDGDFARRCRPARTRCATTPRRT